MNKEIRGQSFAFSSLCLRALCGKTLFFCNRNDDPKLWRTAKCGPIAKVRDGGWGDVSDGAGVNKEFHHKIHEPHEKADAKVRDGG